MNIFILDFDPKLAAQYQCDKHVVKMCLESTQLLSTASHLLTGAGPYKKTHENHPCAIWARKSYHNYCWLLWHTEALFQEYTTRYNKVHKSIYAFAEIDLTPDLFDKQEVTPFMQAMPDQYKHSNPVTAYRNYYIHEKAPIAKWAYTSTPEWFKNNG